MRFLDVLGQENLIDSLINSVKNNALSHSYIFEGPEGIGKETIAKTFAQFLLCELQTDDACDKCKSCLLSKSENHPDVKVISSDKSISVNTIREMIKDIGIKPYYGGKKVYIILNAETMTAQAQNSLLKTLEEPPEYAVIILTTVNAKSLLSTLQSRCIIKKFMRNTNEQIEKYILTNYPQVSSDVQALGSLANGIIGKAQEIIKDDSFFEKRKETFNIIKTIITGTKIEALETEKFFTQQKDSIDIVFDIMVLWLRDMLIINSTYDKTLLINYDYENTIVKMSRNLDSKKISDNIKAVLEAKNNLQSHANFSATIGVMILKINNVQGALV